MKHKIILFILSILFFSCSNSHNKQYYGVIKDIKETYQYNTTYHIFEKKKAYYIYINDTTIDVILNDKYKYNIGDTIFMYKYK